MSNFTHISPATTVNLLSLKTPALITLYTTVHSHVSPATPATPFTTKSTKLQIVTVLNNILAASNTTYEDAEASLRADATTDRTQADTENGGPIPPTPLNNTPDGHFEPTYPNVSYTPAEQALAASAIKRLRKNGVADTTIRSTLTEAMSAPAATEDDGTTSHGVAAAGLAILDLRPPATTPQSNHGTRTTLLPTTIITSVVAANPKKPHGASAARFNGYYTLTAPFTVADVLATTSITRGDILWDVRHGFITFG